MFFMQIWPVLGQLLEIVLVTGVKARLRVTTGRIFMIDVTKWHFIWLILIIFFNIGPITLAWMRVNVLSTILNLCKFVNVDRSYIGR
jgi:hypothetical protein